MTLVHGKVHSFERTRKACKFLYLQTENSPDWSLTKCMEKCKENLYNDFGLQGLK